MRGPIPDLARQAVRAVKSARTVELDPAEDEILDVVATNTGAPLRLVRTAVSYWAHHPGEVDAEIAAAEGAELDAEEAWRRERNLLAR